MTSTEVVNLFAEIGVILVLFVVGMEFPIAKLRKIGKRAFII
ncbi:MAG TPA: cation:proton antiporter, partial [Nitrososphaeraceae archaeon]